jgi:hypothetical protein
VNIWDKLVARYFDAAFSMIEGEQGSGTKDAAAIAASSPNPVPSAFEERVEVLREWIIDYSVHRVRRKVDDGETSFARAAARNALSFFDARTADRQARPNIYALFGDLRQELGNAVDGNGSKNRKLLSLTSKVLWCRYPNDAPIYDDFASTALYVLLKLLKATEEPGTYENSAEEAKYDNADYDPYWKEKTWDGANKLMADSWYYRDYAFTHSFLFARCRPAIESYLSRENASHATAFRVFDKMLWLLGNDGMDYSLKGSDISSQRPESAPAPH